MTDNNAEIEALIASAARVLDLDIQERQRLGIIANFRNFLSLYRTVEGFEEPSTRDPLGIYRP